MANRKKSGVRVYMSALFLCIGLTGQMLTAGLTAAQAAGTADAGNAGLAGNAGTASAGNTGTSAGTALAGNIGLAGTVLAGNAGALADTASAGNTGLTGTVLAGNAGTLAGDAGLGSTGNTDSAPAEGTGMAPAGNAGSVPTEGTGMAPAGNADSAPAGTPGAGNTAPGMGAGGPSGAGRQMVRAEAGIIEVQSGFIDEKGRFWQMKSGSGFLIANKESATYIVTNCSSVSNTPRRIKKFCKKNSIDTENMQLTNSIRVVITGDVTASAEVVVKSAEKDYCVLSAANVVSQKESLKLGDSARIAANDLVYAYGFPKQPESGEETIEYSERDVRAIQGAVTQTEAYLEGGVYLAHSAPVIQGYEGGPLMDADGYVIGLNCKQSPEDDTGIAYALPINEISAVLDNFSIYYGSRAIDEARAQLEAAYQECTIIQAEGGYKKATMEALDQAIEAAGEMLNQPEPYAADLLNAVQALVTARDALVPKTEVLFIIDIVMAVCDLILFIWMLVLAVKNAQEKKQMDMRRMQPSAQGAGYQGPQGMGAQNRQRQPSAQSVNHFRQPSPQGANNSLRQPSLQGAANNLRQPSAQSAEHFRQPVAPPAGRRLRLIRQKTGQMVVLNKNQFIVGKSQTLADYCIADNQTISRKHAMLFEDNGGWYIDDLSSLNGTCVNGKKVVPGEAVRLRGGDEITLSDEEFLVQD